jgi:hypothetical protein
MIYLLFTIALAKSPCKVTTPSQNNLQDVVLVLNKIDKQNKIKGRLK